VNASSQAVDEAKPDGRAGFEPLFEAYYERTARLIARLVKDPSRAEELAVEVFWKLWRNPQAHGEAVGGWIYRTAVRAGLYELRRQSRRTRLEQWFGLTSAPSTPEDLRAANEAQEQVRRVLARLPGRDAELLLLRNQDLSYADISAALRLNPNSVGTLLSRAQQSFRKEYQKLYGPKNTRP
jgi:RNA polymerase sigma-70 factor (ECF subfamily)